MAVSLQQVPQPLRRRLYLPAYTVGEAARLVETKPVTLAYWFYKAPVFARAKERRLPLSYLQLIEASFVASYRKLGVSLPHLREALARLSKMSETEYPFAWRFVQVAGAHFLEDLHRFIRQKEEGAKLKWGVIDRVGWEATGIWPKVIWQRFDQFEYEYEVALRWFPRGKAKPIVIDPRISFGAPIVLSTGVATWVIKERYQAGETLEELEEDFGIGRNDLLLALEFEGVPMESP